MALNPKHARFVTEFMIDHDATNAAKRAGYSAKSAHSTGYDLLQRPDVAAVIEKEQAALATKHGVTVDRIVAELAKIGFATAPELIALGPGAKLADKRAALVDLASHLGMFIDRKEIRTGPLETKSDDELDRIIRGAAAEAQVSLGAPGEGKATKH